MSKNSQNKFYYEIGVTRGGELLEEYTTELPVIRKGNIIDEKLISLLKKVHGNDICVLYNKKNGIIPDDDRSRIDIAVPSESKLNYNK